MFCKFRCYSLVSNTVGLEERAFKCFPNQSLQYREIDPHKENEKPGNNFEATVLMP